MLTRTSILILAVAAVGAPAGRARASGYADPNFTVEVAYGDNTYSAHRDGSLWFSAVPVDNASHGVAAVLTVTVRDQDGAAVSVRTAKRFVAKAVEDGNDIVYSLWGVRQCDSLWDYTWDGEDHLVGVQSSASVQPACERVKVTCTYLPGGRRATKSVYSWDDANGCYKAQADSTVKFVYAGLGRRSLGEVGWLLLAELDGNDRLLRSYVWGRDLGGGGVGGLLAVKVHDPNDEGGAVQATYCVVKGDNGNVAGLVDAAENAEGGHDVAASFEYAPYGELLSADGPAADLCPLLFSTKYLDAETGLYYYGYRYYEPSTGTWLSRDPLAEEGGFNLYGFCHRDPVNRVDPYGLWYEVEIIQEYKSWQNGKYGTVRRWEATWGAWHVSKVTARGTGGSRQWMEFIPDAVQPPTRQEGKHVEVSDKNSELKEAALDTATGFDVAMTVIHDAGYVLPGIHTGEKVGGLLEQGKIGEAGFEFVKGVGIDTALTYTGLKAGRAISNIGKTYAERALERVAEQAARNMALEGGRVAGAAGGEAAGRIVSEEISSQATRATEQATAQTVKAETQVAARVGRAVEQGVANAEMAAVSRWGRHGLQPGDWVMKGPANWWNYLRSFKWQPGLGNQFASKASGETFQVPKDAIKWPSGWGIDGWWKGLFGQRKYVAPQPPPPPPLLPPGGVQ